MPHVVLDLGQDVLVAGVTRPGPDPDRDALAGDSQADHDLRQVITVVLGLAVPAEPVLAAVFLVPLEVRGGGVEEQHVDFEVEQVRGGEEHRFLHRPGGIGLGQQVHRPVRLIVVHRGQARDDGVLADPLRGR